MLRASCLLLVVAWSLWRSGLRRANARLRYLSRPRTIAEVSPTARERIERNIGIAATLLPVHLTCLPRALVTSAMLQHQGIAAEIRIGVRTDAAGLAAHAWVEVDGRPVGDSLDVIAGFSSFDETLTPAVLAAMQ